MMNSFIVYRCRRYGLQPGQPHQSLSQNIHQALDISGLKSRISITAGKRSAACGRGMTRPAPPLPERQDSACNPNPAFQAVAYSVSAAGCAALTCGYENLTLRVIRITDFDAVAPDCNCQSGSIKRHGLQPFIVHSS
jgi:hypothetical protein